MTSDSITCVIPTLESAATLETTLQSLASQGGLSVKLLVADSASTDETLEICRRRNVSVIQVEAGNIYRAINAGLAFGDTEWFTYLNSDDWLYPGSLARMIDAATAARADVVYGNCDYADWQGRFVYSFAAAHPEELMPLFRRGRMGFAQPAAIFRSGVYRMLKGFDDAFQYKADADFFIRALQAGFRFAFCEGPPVACFRLHAGQLSNRKKELIEREGARLFKSPVLAPRWGDLAALFNWRMRNVPHYLIRSLRETQLSKRLRFPRSVEEYSHQ